MDVDIKQSFLLACERVKINVVDFCNIFPRLIFSLLFLLLFPILWPIGALIVHITYPIYEKKLKKEKDDMVDRLFSRTQKKS